MNIKIALLDLGDEEIPVSYLEATLASGNLRFIFCELISLFKWPITQTWSILHLEDLELTISDCMEGTEHL